MVTPRGAGLIAAGAAFAVAAFAFMPALAAGFHVEDYAYVALMRHLPSPWTLLVDNIFFVYYYRATGMLFWWLSVQLAGTDAWWHNLFDLIVHAGNAGLLAVLASMLARNAVAGAVAGIAFACLPAAASTAMWMSDRYDPLALLFGMLALIAFERAIAGSRAAVIASAIALLLAIASKEVAFAVAALMFVRALVIAWQRRTLPIALLLAAIVPVAVALLMRVLTVQTLETSLGVTDLIDATLRGTIAWWQRLPAAVAGFHAVSGTVIALIAIVAILALAAIALGIVARRPGVSILAVSGALLVVVPSVIQWPVTSLVLPHDEALAFVVNLRFYHLAMAGLALLLSAAMLGLHSPPFRVVFAALLLPLCVGGVVLTRSTAHAWATVWAPPVAAYQSLASALDTRTYPSACRIRLDVRALPSPAVAHIDTIVKAGVPRHSSILHCSVTAAVPSHVTLVDAGVCDSAAWPAFGIRRFHDEPAVQRMGALCAISFDGQDNPAHDAARFAFAVAADGSIRETGLDTRPFDPQRFAPQPGGPP